MGVTVRKLWKCEMETRVFRASGAGRGRVMEVVVVGESVSVLVVRVSGCWEMWWRISVNCFMNEDEDGGLVRIVIMFIVIIIFSSS